MVLATLGEFMQRLDWLGVLWGGLWTALVVFSLGLSFLLWTRWGEYHLTGKCVIFSLLAHTIIGLFFATAEVVEDVVVALNTPNEEPPITIDRVKITSAEDDPNATIDGGTDEPSSPGMWDRVTSRAPIDSVSLSREGPDSLQSLPIERTRGGDVATLPQRTPQPEVPIVSAKRNDPELTRPAAEAMERAEMSSAPSQPSAAANSAKSEVLPDSAEPRAAPTLGSSPLNRVRVAQQDSGNDSFEQGSARSVPRVATSGSGNLPKSVPEPVAAPFRSGAGGLDSVAKSSSGPISKPDATPRSETAPRANPRSDTSAEPSTSVRIGVPAGSTRGTDTSAVTRSGSPDSESVALPKPRITGASPAAGAKGPATSSAPGATAVRPPAPAGGTGALGVDRAGIQVGTPEIYRERMNPNRSEQAVKRGGSKASEEAVGRALQWLANHQEEDGHWDVDGFHAHCPAGHACTGTGSQNRDDSAVTGLVLLAFLGAGHTHWDGTYSTNVVRGLNWLLQQEKANGDLRGTGRMYSQGIATLALSEAFGMTNDPKLRDPVERAAQFIIAAQNQSSGGWRYLPGQYGDTSVFGWQLMALKSASLAGIPVPESTWQKARGWLHLVGSGRHRGLAAYQPTEAPTPPMTAEALVCRVFLGESTDSPTLREAADYLMQYKPQWSRLNLYYWYYGTLACFQMNGDYWTQWNTSVRDVLISHQVRSGHATGSWDPNATLDPWGREGGRVYSTALAALCLEVYYRFLPVQSLTSDPVARAPAPNP